MKDGLMKIDHDLIAYRSYPITTKCSLYRLNRLGDLRTPTLQHIHHLQAVANSLLIYDYILIIQITLMYSIYLILSFIYSKFTQQPSPFVHTSAFQKINKTNITSLIVTNYCNIYIHIALTNKYSLQKYNQFPDVKYMVTV